MQVNIEFGGFYESIHSGIVDGCVERMFCDDNGIVDWDNVEVDWSEANNNYMREWLWIFAEWLKDEYGVIAAFKKPVLKSPKYYNFATDTIDCNLTKREVTDIVDLCKGQIEFLNYLADATQSRSGFISFYTFKEALADKDGVLIQYALRFLADQFNDTELDFYFDRNYCYERVV